MRLYKPQTQSCLLKNKKAASPAISTIILTGTTIVVILVAMFYATGYLNRRMAENEFSANKQFMLTTGLQIDDIAWTVGRTQTIRYTTTYGNIQFQSLALNYTFEVYDGTWKVLSSNQTGMILFNMPVSMYSAGNNYFERLSSDNGAFIQSGPSAPVASVYCIEKLPMRDGNYTRIVAVPSIRMLNSSITGSGGVTTSYYKFFLPTLVRASASPYLSQSVSLTGTDIEKVILNGVSQVRVTVNFPNGAPVSTNGFDSDFFRFSGDSGDFYHVSKTVALPSNSVVELYIGKITVGLGVA